MDYIEAGKIRQLRIISKQLVNMSEDQANRDNALSEIDMLIDISE